MKTILVDAIGAFVIKGEGIYKPMQQMLDTFPNDKIILTGANDEQMIEFGLTNLPYELFTLKHNPEKTEPEYFKKMLQQYKLSSDDVVYFEHSQEAVVSAQSAGIITYFYDPVEKNIDVLQKFLDKNL